MRILLAPHLFLPNYGGVEVAVYQLCKQFLQLGLAVTVVTSRWPRELPSQEVMDGVEVIRLPFRRPIGAGFPSFSGVIRSMQCSLALSRVTSRRNYDVLNVHYPADALSSLLLASAKRRIPVVLSFHGSDINLLARKSRFHRLLVALAIKRASAVVTNSRSLGADLNHLYPQSDFRKLTVIGNGVDIDGLDSQKPTFNHIIPYILGVGRLESFKGFDILIEAFSTLQSRYPDHRLVLVGDGPERSSLERQSRALGIGNRVVFTGKMTHQAVLGVYPNCALLAIPSRQESFGMVALEAMAAGKPVVAFRTGGLPEIVRAERTGVLVDGPNPLELARGIDRILGDRAFAVRLGTNGRKVVQEEYSWERAASKYLDVYEACFASCDQT